MTKFIDSGAAKLRIEEAATKKQVSHPYIILYCFFVALPTFLAAASLFGCGATERNNSQGCGHDDSLCIQSEERGGTPLFL